MAMKLFAATMVLGLLAAQSGTGHAGTSSQGNWRIHSEKSPVDDSETVLLTLRSQAPFRNRFGQEKWGTITIGCDQNQTSFTIQLGGEFLASIQNFGYVTFRLDKQKAEKIWLFESTDNEALGLWDEYTVTFVKKIAEGKSMFVRATPFNQSSVDMVFNLTGIKSVLPKVAKACGW